MANKSPLTHQSAFFCIIALAIALTGVSCTQEEPSFLLRSDFSPVGKVIEYSLQLHRVGTVFENGEPLREVDFEIDADIIYTTQEILPGNIAVVLEQQKWDMDKTDDSGKVTREVKERAYRLHFKPNGKVVGFEVVSAMSPAWTKYIRQYYEQGMPIFPSEKIKVGHSWTQYSTVELENGEMVQSGTTYTVKGTARKLKRDCVILEYTGNLTLPYIPDSKDSTEGKGHDQIEMNGLLYLDHEAGILVSSEERRRIISTRSFYRDNQLVEHVAESDEMVSSGLKNISVE